MEHNEWNKAIKYFKKTINFSNYYQSYINLANIYFQQGKYKTGKNRCCPWQKTRSKPQQAVHQTIKQLNSVNII